MPETLLRNETKKLLKQIDQLIVLTIEQHERAKNAIAQDDKELALSVLEKDKKIDTIYSMFKANSEFVITMRPLGKDLRRTVAYMGMARDIERLADYAKHISKFVIKQKKITASSKSRIRSVHKPFRKMLDQLKVVVDSEKPDKVMALSDDDDLVDAAAIKVRKKILQSVVLKDSPDEVEQRLFVLMVANALERAGDHIVHVCKSIIYIATGQHSFEWDNKIKESDEKIKNKSTVAKVAKVAKVVKKKVKDN